MRDDKYLQVIIIVFVFCLALGLLAFVIYLWG